MQHYKKQEELGASSAAESGFPGSAATRLGTYAKSITPPLPDRSPKGAEKGAERRRELRAERYQHLATARDLLFRASRKEGVKYASKYHRTSGCCYLHRGSVDVLRSQEHGSAFYAGLTTCGSVWSCPVCSAKVQERRREEIAEAIRWAYSQGLQPVMVTLTFPHRAWSNLDELLAQQRTALQRLRAGEPWRRFKDRHGYRGLIRSLEITHGKNGWHPHTHELWFVDAGVDAASMKAQVLQRWRSACERAGLLDDGDTGFDKHAVDVKGWCDASEYLAKQDDSKHWGVDRELAKASTKGSKGIHPFGLLARHADGDERAGALFVAYSKAMKGKRQLFWSRGLKALVGVDEKTDEQLAEESQDNADVLGKLLAADWKLVRDANAQAALLDLAEDDGWRGVKMLLDTLASCVSERYTGDIQEIDVKGSENEQESGQHDASSPLFTRTTRGVRRKLQKPGQHGGPGVEKVHAAVRREAWPGQLQALTGALDESST